ncbi:hypothetical protein HPP92_004745 [Vanilla planifolia]|uniref:Uncharacterized protein n=1 Tax=Vanilla planifolia TaxID=51239 RepID=A0A835VER2_VANPL|nr:hypothetical protein HPP92_004745 [Vanilla planifolia]
MAPKSDDPQTLRMIAGAIANLCGNGNWKGRSLLIEDGALHWIVANCTAFTDRTRHHMELALCHLAQNEDNAFDIMESGAIRELLRISKESSREDICKLARKALNSNPSFYGKTAASVKTQHVAVFYFF